MNENLQGKEIDTTVDTVTVYTDRARIARRGKTNVTRGLNQLSISGLPLTLEPDSLRAKAAGTARAKILGVDLARSFYKDVPPGKSRELTVQIRSLEDEDRVLADNCESLMNQVKHLDGLADATTNFAIGLARGTLSPESHGQIIDMVTGKRMATQEKLRAIILERRDLQLTLEKLRNELNQIENIKPHQRYTAVVEVEVSREGDLEIELIYTLPGVSWKPIYDIRLSEDLMEINYLGQVSQRTGEDWENVTVVLSTVPPTSGTREPELEPWYVEPFRPLPPPVMQTRDNRGRAYAPSPAPAMAAGLGIAAADAMVEMEDTAAEPEIEEALFSSARVEQSGASVTYTIANKVNIPGDGSPHKAMIECLKLSPETDYVTAPRLECKAYRRVYADNKSEFMLLPGQAQVFENEDYIGKTFLKLVAPGEQIKLYAGTDERIRIERKLVNREMDKKFLADKRLITYKYEIKLENHTGKEQTVIIRDQVPLPRHEDIKIKVGETTPKLTEKDGMNRLKWEMKIPARGKEEIRYEFNIEHPRDMQILGLP